MMSTLSASCVPCPDGAVPIWSDQPCGEAPDEDGTGGQIVVPTLMSDHPCDLISGMVGGSLVPIEDIPQHGWLGATHATMEFQQGLIGNSWVWTSLPAVPILDMFGGPAVIEPVNVGNVENELVLWDIGDIGDVVWIHADSMPFHFEVIQTHSGAVDVPLETGSVLLEDGSAILWYRNEINVDGIQHWYLDTGIRGWHQPSNLFPQTGAELAGPNIGALEPTNSDGTIFRRVHGWCRFDDGLDDGQYTTG